MPITDDRTPALNLPLPYADNWLEADSQRLREALLSIDTAVAGKASTASIAVVNTALTAKADLVGGKIPAAQLPAYVDDVLEFASLAAFPGTGESGKIYIALDSGKTYRWGGSLYAEISASPGSTDAVPEGASNLYFTPSRAADAVPLATYTVPGKVKVGNGLGIDGDGFLFSALGGGSAMSIVEVVPVTNGLTQVGVPGEYVVGSILVAVNGAFLAPSDYTATDGIVVSFIGFTVGTADSIVIVKLSTIIISSLPPGSVGTTQLTNDGVTFAKLQNIATARVLGRTTAGTGDVEELDILPAVSGENLTNLNAEALVGLVPAANLPNLPTASETVAGIAELSSLTQAAVERTDNSTIMTPLRTQQAVDAMFSAIQTINPASMASVTFTNLTLPRYTLLLDGLRSIGSTQQLVFQVSTNNGATWTSVYSSDSVDWSANGGLSGAITFFTSPCIGWAATGYRNVAASAKNGSKSVVPMGTGATINAVRLLWASGSFGSAAGQKIELFRG